MRTTNPSPIILLNLYELARHGIVIRHWRRSDEDRPLCRKAFRIGSPAHGWQRDCVQCSRLRSQFDEQQRQELVARFAQQHAIDGAPSQTETDHVTIPA